MNLKAKIGADLSFTRNELRETDEFLSTITSIFISAKYFGLPSYGGVLAHCYGITLFLLLAALEAGAVWKIILVLGVAATDGRGLVARLSGCVFYGNALLSLILTWRFISSWKCISVLWTLAETTGGLYFPPDLKIKRRVIIVTCNFIICAIVEHVMSMISATGLDIPPEEYFDRYILSSHGFLLKPEEYNIWLGIVIFVLSKLATILWNFQDLIIILISMGLTSRYRRLNKFVDDFVRLEKRHKEKAKLGTELYAQVLTWRRLREAYVRQATLVRKVDQKLGKLILLCNLNNFYFICLQLFLGLNQNSNMGVINKSYYFYSLGWLLFRACSVVLVAADVNLHSKKALSCLYCCPGSAYNVEIKRLENQLTYDFVALSGMRFFFLDRQLFLEVAAAIVKYELVMIQYDNQ
ncbi:gustatory receptor for sugar taste 64a-like [Hyposmocoma kahamanoa]|uniref:gustatory receptor for sugar taste 64a-like n=1 Tax=Hyposmocoma kahamanoa TaxID=1477025 RepID=UPI000E6D80AA|nr:gustatory receptor for sugar taste 64a-like [Hyposmocoma kahamanoa]